MFRRILATVALLATLAGCDASQISLSPAKSTVVATTRTPLPPGELYTGAAKHVLPLAGGQAVLTFWAPEAGPGWNPATLRQVDFSLVFQAKNSALVKLTRMNVSLGPVKLVDDRGEYVVGAPYAYTSAVVLPPDSRGVVQIGFSADLEQETTPGSGAYFRATFSDVLRVSTERGDK